MLNSWEHPFIWCSITRPLRPTPGHTGHEDSLVRTRKHNQTMGGTPTTKLPHPQTIPCLLFGVQHWHFHRQRRLHPDFPHRVSLRAFEMFAAMTKNKQRLKHQEAVLGSQIAQPIVLPSNPKNPDPSLECGRLLWKPSEGWSEQPALGLCDDRKAANHI